MGEWLFYLGGAACVATLGVLAIGIGGFGTGKMTSRGQNRLMRWRIIAQFTAVVLLTLAVLAVKAG